MTAPPWAARAAVLALLALSVACVVAAAAVQRWAPGGGESDGTWLAATALLYAIVGAIVLRRHPGHRIGWLLLVIGVLVTTGHLAEQLVLAAHVSGHDVPGATVALWYVQWYWLPFVFTQFAFIPLLFPTGEALSPRWRRFTLALIVVATTATVGGMFGQRLMLDFAYLDTTRSFDNPVGFLPFEDIETGAIAFLWFVPLLAGVVGALASLVLRYRRSRGVARQQMKWGAFGLGVTAGAFVLWGILDAIAGVRFPISDALTNAVAPIAMGLAITRYRLWELDRLISRTLAYVVVTAVLASGYVALVVGVQGLGGTRDLPDLAVAAATLVAAAVFRPLRRRVQALVDRRFNRSRYDGVRVLERFGEGLRDEVDAAVLADQVRRVVERTMAPATSSVWLAEGTSR